MLTGVHSTHNNGETRSAPFHINFPPKMPKSLRFTPSAFACFEFLWKLWQPDCRMLKRAAVGLALFPNRCAACLSACLASLWQDKRKKNTCKRRTLSGLRKIDELSPLWTSCCAYVVAVSKGGTTLIHIKFNFKTAAGVEVNLGCLFDPLARLTDL